MSHDRGSLRPASNANAPHRRPRGENGGVADQMKPAYLIHGTDVAKIDEARSRLRRRAEDEGGTASLEVFEPAENRGSPDADALVEAISAMSLIPSRRYLLADRIEKWGKRQAERVNEAVLNAPPDTTVVLVCRGKLPEGIEAAVRKTGGEVLTFEAPSPHQLPAHLVGLASRKNFELTSEAARFLIGHLGTNLTRLGNELDRLALWAGQNGRVEIEDLEEMVADTSDVGPFVLGDALIQGDRVRAFGIADKMMSRGATAGGTVPPTAFTIRRATKSIASGRGLPSHLRGASIEDLRTATIAMADLEIWTRGGAEYPDELALDLALIAATDEAG